MNSILDQALTPKPSHVFQKGLTFPSFFDNTSLKMWRKCEKAGYWLFHRRLVTEGMSIHLHAGSAFALGLEVTRKTYFNEQVPFEVALTEGVRAMIVAFGDFDCPPYIDKTIDRLVGAMVYYFKTYPIDQGLVPFVSPSGKYGIEYNFAIPLPIDHPETGEPLLYTGRMDMLGIYNGNIFVEDDKTTSQLGQRWYDQWPLASGMMGYVWGCRESGIKVAGALIRGIALRKYDYDCAEVPLFMPDWMITRWYENTLLSIEQIVKAYKEQRWQLSLGDACSFPSKCSYFDLCSAQDPEGYIPVSFKPNTWNPLEQHK